jgi:hypothetical protein
MSIALWKSLTSVSHTYINQFYFDLNYYFAHVHSWVVCGRCGKGVKGWRSGGVWSVEGVEGVEGVEDVEGV